MQQHNLIVNPNTTAPLTNVALCRDLMEYSMNLPRHVDRMVGFSGYSGLGKSMAATFTANTFKAYYLEILDTWNKKAFLTSLAKRMGVRTHNSGSRGGKTPLTISEILDGIAEELATSGRPLILDDMHLIADGNMVETVRDIYKRSGKCPMLLIGEEGLPDKLKQWEAFDGRISKWQLAQPADWDDACHLRTLYVRDLAVFDDLLQAVLERTKGSVRRIVTNLENIQEEARENGWTTVDLKTWGTRPIFTGQAPKRGN